MFNFNKKSIYCGNSMKEFNMTRDLLDCHHIKYKYKLSDRNTSTFFPGRGVNRTMYGSSPQSLDQGIVYEIFVANEDFELSQKLIQKELK